MARSFSLSRLRGRDFFCPALAAGSAGRIFTLIELLVVVSIISLLAGMLLPALRGAREKGRQAGCQSNLREIFLAIELYKSHHDEYYPICCDWAWPNYPAIFWAGAQHGSGEDLDFTGSPLYPYLKTGEIKTCLGFKEFAKGYQPGSGGYGYNKQFVGGNKGDQWFYKQHKDSDIKTPSETAILSDCAGIKSGAIVESYSLSSPYYKTIGGATWDQLSPSIHFRHNSRANVTWCDGHVSSEKMSYSWTLYGNNYGAAHLGFIGESSSDPAIANKLYGHHEP